MDKLLPTSEAFNLTPDGMMTLSVKPLDVSSDGQFVVYEQLVVTGSGEHKRFLVNQNIISDQIVFNFNDLISNGDPSKTELGKMVADWDNHRFLVSYRDLTDQASNSSGTNRLALIENGSVIDLDIISSTINTTANASITNFSFSKTTLNTIYVESAASNLATDFFDLDTNGVKDIYAIDLSSSSSKRISLSEGLEVTENVELIESIKTPNSKDLVVFQTTSDAFSTSDENADLDIYVIDPSSSSSEISLISHDINGDAIGALRDEILVTNDSIYFVSDANNIVANEFNSKADIFQVLLSDMTTSRYSTFSDNVEIGSNVSFYLHDIDYHGNLLFTVAGSSNTQIDNQIVTFSNNTFDVVSNTNGENGNDISLEAHSSDGEGKLGSIAYFTYATNLLSSPNTTIINYESLNSAPTITTTTSLTTDEDTATSAIAFSGADVDGDTLSFTFSNPAKGSVVDNGNGTFTYTPDANANGSDSFTITANDGTVDVTETVNVTVNAVNDAPSITSTAVTSVNEDSAYSYTVTTSDVDADTVTPSAVTLPSWLSFDQSTGILSGTPTNDDVGVHDVTLRVNDGTVNVDQSFKVTVTNTNDAPTITTTTSLTTDEDTATSAIAFSGTDVDRDTLTFTFSDPAKGSVVDNGNGTFTYTPDANANGSDSFTITANDGLVDVTETVNVTVNAVNDAPTITTTKIIRSDKDTPTSQIAFTGSDADGDTLTFTFSNPSKGSVIDNGNGTFTYTPDTNTNGPDSFTITANDGTVDVTETILIYPNPSVKLGNETPKNIALEFIDHEAGVKTANVTNGKFEFTGIGKFSHAKLDSSAYAADIAINDVISSLKHIVGLETLNGASKHAADVDNNGAVAITDVISQLKHIVGLETLSNFDLINSQGERVNEITDTTLDLQLVLNGDVDLSTAFITDIV